MPNITAWITGNSRWGSSTCSIGSPRTTVAHCSFFHHLAGRLTPPPMTIWGAWSICASPISSELYCALVGTLARGFLSRWPAPQRAVELIEQPQAHFWSTACGAQPKVVLAIKLCERYGGPLFYEFVQTHTTCPCEVLEPLVLGRRQTNGPY